MQCKSSEKYVVKITITTTTTATTTAAAPAVELNSDGGIVSSLSFFAKKLSICAIAAGIHPVLALNMLQVNTAGGIQRPLTANATEAATTTSTTPDAITVTTTFTG